MNSWPSSESIRLSSVARIFLGNDNCSESRPKMHAVLVLQDMHPPRRIDGKPKGALIVAVSKRRHFRVLQWFPVMMDWRCDEFLSHNQHQVGGIVGAWKGACTGNHWLLKSGLVKQLSRIDALADGAKSIEAPCNALAQVW